MYPSRYRTGYQTFRYPLYNKAARKSQLGNHLKAHSSYYGANNYRQLITRGQVPFSWSTARRAYPARPYPYGHFIPFKDWSKKGMPRNFVAVRKDNKSIKNSIHATSITQQGASRRYMNARVPPAWQRTLYNSQPRPLFSSSSARTGYAQGTKSFWGSSPALKSQHPVFGSRQSVFKTQGNVLKPAKQVQAGVGRPVVQVSSSNIKTGQITNQTPNQVGHYLPYHGEKPTVQGNYGAYKNYKAQKYGIYQQVGTSVNRLAKAYAPRTKVLPVNQVTNQRKLNNVPYNDGRAAGPAVTIHINPQVLPNKVGPAISKTEVQLKPTNQQPATTTSFIPPSAITSSDVTKLNVQNGNQPSSTYQGSSFLGKAPITNGRVKTDNTPVKTNKLTWSSLPSLPAALTRANVRKQNSVSHESLTSTTNVSNEKMKASFSSDVGYSKNTNKPELTQQSLAAALNNSIREDLSKGVLMHPQHDAAEPSINPVKLNSSEAAKAPVIHVISLSPGNQLDKYNLKGNRSHDAVVPKQVAAPTYIQIRTNTSEVGLRNFLNNLAKFYVLKKSNETHPTLNRNGNKPSLTSQASNASLQSTDNSNTAGKKDMFHGPNVSLSSKAQNISSTQPGVLGQTIALKPSVPTGIVPGQSLTAQIQVQNQNKTLIVPFKTVNPVQNTPNSFKVSSPPNAVLRSQAKLQIANGKILKTAPFQVPVITIKPVIVKVAGNNRNFLAKAVKTNSITAQIPSANNQTPLPEKRVSNVPPVQPAHIDYGIMGNDNPQPYHTGGSTTRNHIPGEAIVRTFNGIGNGVVVRSKISNAGRTPSDYRRSEIPRPAIAYSRTQLRIPAKASGGSITTPLLVPSIKRNQALKPRSSFGISRTIPQLRGPIVHGNAMHRGPHKQFQKIPQTGTLGRSKYNLDAYKSPNAVRIGFVKRPNPYTSGAQGQRKSFHSTPKATLPYKGSFPLKLHKVSPYFEMKRYLNNNVNDKPRVRRRFLELRPRTRRRFLEIEGKSINQMINQSINQSITHSLTHSINQSID